MKLNIQIRNVNAYPKAEFRCVKIKMQFKETFQNRLKENILCILPLVKINVTLNDHKLAKMGM